MAGAIALAAMAAARSGSGLVSVVVPDRCLETVASFDPGLMTIPAPDTPDGQFAKAATATLQQPLERATALAIGPGMRTGEGAVQWVHLLATAVSKPRVFDADALNALALQPLTSPFQGPVVLTPHPGEWQRLSGVSAKDRSAQIEAAVQLASRWNCVVVLKGTATLVTDGQSRWFNSTGNPGMAKGGSGDCLTGLISGLLAQGLSAWDAARLGVYTHGLAGDLAAQQRGQYGMTPQDLIHCIPDALNAVLDDNQPVSP